MENMTLTPNKQQIFNNFKVKKIVAQRKIFSSNSNEADFWLFVMNWLEGASDGFLTVRGSDLTVALGWRFDGFKLFDWSKV